MFKARNADRDVRLVYEELLKNYNKNLRPDYLGDSVNVLVDGTILSFGKVDPTNMKYTVDMYFRQRWNDYRLRHNLTEKLTIISGSDYPSSIIWTPDTFFLNSVSSIFHHVTVNNHKIDIYPNGFIFWGTRVTASPVCNFNLASYPMDTQMCDIKISSYGLSSRHIKYKWLRNPGFRLLIKNMDQFSILSYNTSSFYEKNDMGNEISVLYGKFIFQRQLGFAIFEIYIPSTALVCLSWVALWMPRSCPPVRAVLCVLILLTVSTVWASINAKLPEVSYVKNIDVYMFVTFCCVILNLIEYVVLMNLNAITETFLTKQRKKEKKEKRVSFQKNVIEMQSLQYEKKMTEPIKSVKTMSTADVKALAVVVEQHNVKITGKLEFYARIILPLIYIIFNIYYWYTGMNSYKLKHVVF
ncbi:gamma-aminobutyric acid receptor subunit pi isoform X2 [Hydra vulgaris]|uniref:gamma-aminobutyric acid receptor subunit pi isoform X2 n=1 Tax=Hydra vulgaris TaxID=6087 RepID=UPI0032EA1937